MFNALASLILIISLVLGGGGVTAAAAQGRPGEFWLTRCANDTL